MSVVPALLQRRQPLDCVRLAPVPLARSSINIHPDYSYFYYTVSDNFYSQICPV